MNFVNLYGAHNETIGYPAVAWKRVGKPGKCAYSSSIPGFDLVQYSNKTLRTNPQDFGKFGDDD